MPRPLRILWQQALLPHHLKRSGAALLHAPAYVAPWRVPIPYVLTIYDVIALRFPEFCKPLNVAHYRRLMPRSARNAARVIAPSESTKRDIVQLLNVPGERVRVIPLGVAGQFRPPEEPDAARELRRRLNLPERYILYVGNFEPKKNLRQLIEVFADARRSGRVTARLVLAGRKAWHDSELHHAIRRHRLTELVTLLPDFPDADLPALYAGASLFVFPSRTEGFGLPPLEAMACGTPVVASRAGALPEVVADAGLLVSPDRPGELSAAMEKTLGNEFLRRRLRELGLARAKQFTWERTARRTAEVYAEVLGTTPKDH